MAAAISFNLGCGGPHDSTRVDAAYRWVDAVQGQFEVVFVQEVPGDDWLASWKPMYHVVTGPNPRGYRVRSALLIHEALGEPGAVAFRTANYHASYLAAATLARSDGRQLTLASVHASPNPVSDAWRTMWTDCDVEVPQGRNGEVWDSDLLLATVADLSRSRSLLVAGDWNEARDWDKNHPGGSGDQFFQHVEHHGLVDCTWAAWKEERETCRPAHGVSLQVDRVFATGDVASATTKLRVVTDGPKAGGSDHFPIAFAIDVSAG